MIEFTLTGKVVARPRAAQFTAEFQRRYWEENQGKIGVPREWREPPRFGIARRYENGTPIDVRRTTLRVESEGGEQQVGDFWITEERVGKAAFERVLALEVGDRVKITGEVRSERQYGTWMPRPLKVSVLS